MRDADVRKAVRAQLSTQHSCESDTLIVEEMGIWSGSVRIDVAVINGQLSGFELKSDRDTLERLPFQADIYSRVFDRVSLVVGSRHAQKAFSQVPRWWGQIVATSSSDGVALESIKESETNPSPEPYLVAELLRKEEALAILSDFGLAEGWRSKRAKLVHQRLASELEFSDLSAAVRRALKARENWLGKTRSCPLDMSIDTNLNPAL